MNRGKTVKMVKRPMKPTHPARVNHKQVPLQQSQLVVERIPMRRLRDIMELKSEVKENIFRKAYEYAQLYNPNLKEMRYPDSQILFEIRDNKIKQVVMRFPRNTFEARSRTVRDFIDKIVKHPGFQINGNFIINLHDKSDGQPNVNELVFSKNRGTNKGLVPDIYAMENYRNVVDIEDIQSFESKIKKGIFIGATTGSTDINQNERLQMCRYIHHLKQNGFECFFESYINTICQINQDELRRHMPYYEQFVKRENMSVQEQRRYRYCINIDGNTTSWDRMIWVFQGNNILLKKKSDNENWYYSLMEKGKQYVEFEDGEDLNLKIEVLNRMFERNPEKISELIRTQKEFVEDYLNPLGHITYTCALFQYISEKFNNL